MTRSSRPLLAATLLAALIAPTGTAVGADVRPALAPTPNNSLVLYKPPVNGKPGRAVTGTLVNGVFTRKGAFTTRRWTSIAVGRDSMAFYDKGSGKLLTGRFRNGVWKPLKTRTIARGYTHVVASCDTILFYKRSTGIGKTAEFTSGDIRDMRNLTPQQAGFSLLAASCDSLMAARPDALPSPISHLGWLRYGFYRHYATDCCFEYSHLAANTGSYARYFVPSAGPANVQWGALSDGSRTITGESDFGRWAIAAGAADSMLYYTPSTGETWTEILDFGDFLDEGPIPSIGKGWRIIAGGK